MMEEREKFYKIIHKNSHKDGEIIITETTGVPILDEDDHYLGYRGVSVDVTERILSEEGLREKNDDLQQLNDEIYDASYEHQQ